MQKPGIRETLKDFYWAIAFSLAMLCLLASAKLAPPAQSSLQTIEGIVDRITPVRFGAAQRAARLTLIDSIGKTQDVYVDDALVAEFRGHQRLQALATLIGEPVTVRSTRDRVMPVQRAFEITAGARTVVAYSDTTFWDRVRYQCLLAAATALGLLGFYCLHMRFGAYHTRRVQPLDAQAITLRLSPSGR